MNDNAVGDRLNISATQAQHLLNSIPKRPKRVFSTSDHLYTLATITLAFASGLLALSGSPWWATIPGIGAVITSQFWISKRLSRPNEPLLRRSFIPVTFIIWVTLPIWQGIMHGETLPFPEAFVLAGLAPAAWLIFYTVLLIRR